MPFHVTVPDTAQEGKKGFKFVHVAKWHVRGSRPLWEDSRRCFFCSVLRRVMAAQGEATISFCGSVGLEGDGHVSDVSWR